MNDQERSDHYATCENINEECPICTNDGGGEAT